jgi:pimeloyl-ACP methyl ester carboxylesterase
MAVETARQNRDTPGETETTTVTTDGRTVGYAEYGVPSGPALIVFHGLPGSRLFGRLFDDQARDHGVRIVAIDRPGYGQSDPDPSFEPTDVAEVVDPVAETLGLSRFGVVGFSGGAPYALALAARRPKRVRAVDIVSGAVPPSRQETRPRQLRLLAGMASRTPRLLGALLRGQSWIARRRPPIVAEQYTDSAAVSSEVLEQVAADFREAMAETRAGCLRELRDAGSPWPVSLDRVDAPVRLWHGDRDENIPIEGVRRLEDSLPAASLTVFEGADHLQALLRCREPIVRHAGES